MLRVLVLVLMPVQAWAIALRKTSRVIGICRARASTALKIVLVTAGVTTVEEGSPTLVG